MESKMEFFTISQLVAVKGSCQKLISPSQNSWRAIESYEEPPYQKVAKYMRNIEYNQENVRTFSTLKQSLSYLIEQFIPILLKKRLKQQQRYSLAIFLQERLKAIRCQLFVQGIICPRLILSLIKVNIMVQIMKESTEIRNQIVGLDYLIDPIYQKIMKDHYMNEYLQALAISILSINKQQIQGFLIKHQIIFEDQRLSYLLTLRMKIQRNNFETYYDCLQKEQPLVQSLLWRRIDYFKQKLIQVLKKSFGDVPLWWLYRRLGFQQPENQDWINVKQTKQSLKGKYRGFRVWMQIQNLKKLVQN